MSIDASEEWKRHALHPEKAATGETPESEVPAGGPMEGVDTEFGAEEAGVASGSTTGGAGVGSGAPGSGPLDQPEGTTALSDTPSPGGGDTPSESATERSGTYGRPL